MGDYYPDPNRPGHWIYDESAPAPDPTMTSMVPVVPAEPGPDDHDVDLVDPAQLLPFDQIDSRMIRSIEAPS